jgi:hypothetical protein
MLMLATKDTQTAAHRFARRRDEWRDELCPITPTSAMQRVKRQLALC